MFTFKTGARGDSTPGRWEKWTTIRSRRCPSEGASNSLRNVSVSRGIGCRIGESLKTNILVVARRIRRIRRCLSLSRSLIPRAYVLYTRVLFLPASQLPFPSESHHSHKPNKPRCFDTPRYRVRAARFQSRQIARQIHNSFYNWEDSAQPPADDLFSGEVEPKGAHVGPPSCLIPRNSNTKWEEE